MVNYKLKCVDIGMTSLPIKEVIPKIILTTSDGFFDAVRFVIFQVIIKFL